MRKIFAHQVLREIAARATEGWVEAMKVLPGRAAFNPHDPIAIFPNTTSKLVAAGRFPDLWSGRVFLHDPLAVHVALGGPGAKREPMHIAMANVKTGLRTFNRPGLPPDCTVAVDVDGEAFVKHFLEILAPLSRRPPR